MNNVNEFGKHGQTNLRKNIDCKSAAFQLWHNNKIIEKINILCPTPTSSLMLEFISASLLPQYLQSVVTGVTVHSQWIEG